LSESSPNVAEHPLIAIHYRRPPDRLRVYVQQVVHEQDDVIVTVSEPLELEQPVQVNGEIALETGSRAVWFTFPDMWHDIGRFHRADGSFTGVYANILTPPVIDGPIWVSPTGVSELLDEDEFLEGVAQKHVDQETADRARWEAEQIIGRHRRGLWPPPIVAEWTLERVLKKLSAP
jgi:predicted RNA-binding protein associated with RNAse of E/G family